MAPLSLPKPNLRFDHALHVTRNIGCAQCHGAVENLELATRDQLPRMRGCFNCHQAPDPAAGRARSECRTCHLTDPSGMIKISFASGPLSPPSWLHDAGHGPDWIERHKVVAGNDSRFCANCHTEKSCADCHDGRVRPRRIHPNDWLSMHPVAARQNQQKCASCHRDQSFCLTCHQRVGITMSGPFANLVERGRFHPAKSEWTDGPRTPPPSRLGGGTEHQRLRQLPRRARLRDLPCHRSHGRTRLRLPGRLGPGYRSSPDRLSLPLCFRAASERASVLGLPHAG
ncbi:MAG: cytochrome c3 family protein [Pseudomonadota bacterium]